MNQLCKVGPCRRVRARGDRGLLRFVMTATCAVLLCGEAMAAELAAIRLNPPTGSAVCP